MRHDFRIVNKQKQQLVAITIIITTIAILQTHNILYHHKTHIATEPQAETTDYYHFHWNLWWLRHTFSQQTEPYSTNYVLAPFTSNLSLHTLSAMWFPIWSLTEPGVGTGGAVSIIILIATSLSGVTTYVLLQNQQVKPPLALIGAVLVQASALMYESTKWTMLNLIGWFWIPLLLLTWQQIVENTRQAYLQRAVLWSMLLGLILWSMTLTDLQYPLFAAFIVLPYGLWTVAKARCNWKRATLIGLSLLSIAIGLVLLWYLGPLKSLLNYDRSVLATTPAERGPRISFPEGFFWRLERGISLGLLPLSFTITAVIIALRNRASRSTAPWLWLGVAVPPLILSAGASIQLFGQTISMPYVWLHELLGGIFRYPERFANVFLFPALIFSLRVLSTAVPKQGLYKYAIHGGLFLFALIDTRLLRPTPLQPLPPAYRVYEQMGQEDYDYVVVEIPTAGSSGEGIVGRSAWVATQWYGMTHGKRMVNGHISRVNPWHFLWMETADPMMAWLGQRRFLEPDTVAEDMRARIAEWPIGYFVIHTQWLPQNGPTLQEIVGWFNGQRDLVCPFAIERELIVYRTTWHPDGCPTRTPPEIALGVYEIDIGVAGDERFIGWGWHWQEDIGATRWRWIGEYPRTYLYVDLPPDSYRLRLSVQAFWEPRALTISVNGEALLRAEIEPGRLQEIEAVIAREWIGNGEQIEIVLDYDATIVPADVGYSDDPRRLAAAVDWVRFERAGEP